MNPEVDLGHVAELAGLTQARVRYWLQAGLFDKLPARTDAWVARSTMLAQLDRAGVPLDVLVAAEKADALERAFIFEFIRKRRAGLHPLDEVEEKTGLEPILLTRLCYALGFDDTSGFSDDELDCLNTLAACLRDGVPEAMVLETCELWGTQMRFIAAAEVVSYDANLSRRIMSQAESAIEGAARLAPLTYSILRAADMMVRPVHNRHLLQALNLEANAADYSGDESLMPGEVDVAIAFVDLAGYTALTEAEGDRQALIYARRLERIVRTSARSSGPRIVKHLGDGLMLASSSVAGMLDGILDIMDAVDARENLPPARAAVAFGRARSRAGDYFGHTVNLAARVLEEAQPSEVLVTDQVVDASGGEAFAYREPRDVQLRGIREPVRLWRVERLSARGA